MASERVELRYILNRYSMFRMRVHAEKDNLLSVVEVDCFRSPIVEVSGFTTLKAAIDRFGLDEMIRVAHLGGVHCRLLMNVASIELVKWRQEAQQAGLLEVIQADIDPDLFKSKIVTDIPTIRRYTGR